MLQTVLACHRHQDNRKRTLMLSLQFVNARLHVAVRSTSDCDYVSDFNCGNSIPPQEARTPPGIAALLKLYDLRLRADQNRRFELFSGEMLETLARVREGGVDLDEVCSVVGSVRSRD